MGEGKLGLSTSKPALVKNPSTRKPGGHHVAFEVPSRTHHHRSGLSEVEFTMDHHEKECYRLCCFQFCVWACIGLFALIIILLIIGIAYLAFVQGGMPKINVKRLHINNLQVDNSQNMINAIINLDVMVSNKNQKLMLLYEPLTVDVTKEDVQLGRAKVGGFSQNPQNDTDLDVAMTLNNAKVNSHVVDAIKSNMNVNEMVVDVYVGGKIGLIVGKFHMITVPFLSSCRQVKQMDVDSGRSPGCSVKIFAFRPSNN